MKNRSSNKSRKRNTSRIKKIYKTRSRKYSRKRAILKKKSRTYHMSKNKYDSGHFHSKITKSSPYKEVEDMYKKISESSIIKKMFHDPQIYKRYTGFSADEFWSEYEKVSAYEKPKYRLEFREKIIKPARTNFIDDLAQYIINNEIELDSISIGDKQYNLLLEHILAEDMFEYNMLHNEMKGK